MLTTLQQAREALIKLLDSGFFFYFFVGGEG
jgi:hypothetical protein